VHNLMILEDQPLKTTTGEKAGEVVAITLNAVPIAGGDYYF